jgi:hypothetical protein
MTAEKRSSAAYTRRFLPDDNPCCANFQRLNASQNPTAVLIDCSALIHRLSRGAAILYSSTADHDKKSFLSKRLIQAL